MVSDIIFEVDQMVSTHDMATMTQEMPFLFSLLTLMIHIIGDLIEIQFCFSLSWRTSFHRLSFYEVPQEQSEQYLTNMGDCPLALLTQGPILYCSPFKVASCHILSGILSLIRD